MLPNTSFEFLLCVNKHKRKVVWYDQARGAETGKPRPLIAFLYFVPAMGKGRAKRRKRGKRCRPMKRHSLASDPEGDGSDRERRNFLELGWDSWDESTTVSHPHPHGRTCSHTNESRLEEAEITRKFSTLNFSVLPCDALCGGDSTVHQQQLVSGVGESEIEVFSELPSASQLDAMPGLALDARRQGRKRSSR